jgi:hypothetical protein
MPTLGTNEKRNNGRVEPKKPTQVRIVSAVAATTNLTVTFDQPIVLRGTPAWTSDASVDPQAVAVSAVSPSPNIVVITFDASLAAATGIIIPVADPAIRSKVGGFVADTSFAL